MRLTLSKPIIEILDKFDALQEDVKTCLRERDKALSAYLIANEESSSSSSWAMYGDKSRELGEAMKACSELCSEFNSVFSEYTKECTASQSLNGGLAVPKPVSAVTSYCRIVLWPSLPPKPSDKPLLTITCSAHGMPRARIVLFVESVCGPLEGNYKLKTPAGVEIIGDENTRISAGEYALVPDAEGPPLAFKFDPFPIIPSGRLSTGGSQASGSSQPKRDGGGTKRSRQSSSLDAEYENCRISNFKHAIYKRDNHCVITRNYSSVQASHILARAWWGRQDLPLEIVQIVQYLPDTIDNVQNGLLLRTDLSRAFDSGAISVECQGNHYRVIAITPEFEEYDGIMLDENTRIRLDGTSWWETNRPHKDLLAFHLRNSVFKHMTAAGSDDESENGDDECLSPECNAEDSAVDFNDMITPKRQQISVWRDSKANECMRLDTVQHS